jgi:hypothetical protein
VGFLFAIDDNEVGLHSAIHCKDYGAIPPSMRCLNPFGEIDFAIHQVILSLIVESV